MISRKSTISGIFTGSADIKHLLPVESSRFGSISTEFLGLMKKVSLREQGYVVVLFSFLVLDMDLYTSQSLLNGFLLLLLKITAVFVLMRHCEKRQYLSTDLQPTRKKKKIVFYS